MHDEPVKNLAAADADTPRFPAWPQEGVSRIPDWIYTDARLYDEEVRKIFHGPTWNFVGFEAEIPQRGDFQRAYVGPTPVILIRGDQGQIHVVQNRCAHRGAEFCRQRKGNAQELTCPYHQWQYDLAGNLMGVPYRRGVKGGQGGMPADFKLEDNGLVKLRVATRNGLVFASFSDETEALDAYLGPEIIDAIDTVFEGREVQVLGYTQQKVQGNWKLYFENIRDPYHATLLHVFLHTFGLLRADQVSQLTVSAGGRHAIICSKRRDAPGETPQPMGNDSLQLHDKRFLGYTKEDRGPWSVAIQSIWPNFAIQRQSNTLAVRAIIPNGPGEFSIFWTFFGYQGDSEEMLQHRLRQANLMGPGGLVTADDGEVIEFVHAGLTRSVPASTIIRLGGDESGTVEHFATESAVRGMYANYRKTMGI